MAALYLADILKKGNRADGVVGVVKMIGQSWHIEGKSMKESSQGKSVAVAIFLLLTGLILIGTALAEEPIFCLSVDGNLVCYEYAEIERIVFAGDTLVVVTAESTDQFPVVSVDGVDVSSITTSVVAPEALASLPSILNLFPNQPNPIASETRIEFRIQETGPVALKIYGVNGREVRTLTSGHRDAGKYSVVWDGLDDSGREVSTGVYFYRMSAPGIEESRQMVLLR